MSARRLTDVLAETLREWRGVSIRAEDWPLEKLPTHLRVTFAIEDERGAVLGSGKDLDALRLRLGGRALAEVAADASGLERTGLTSWQFGALPAVFETERGGHTARAYPAVVDEGGSVAVRLVATAAAQRRETRRGVRRLLMLALPSPMSGAVRALSSPQRMALSQAPHESAAALLEDCLIAAFDALITDPVPSSDVAFGALRDRARAELPQVADRLTRDVAAALEQYRGALSALDGLRGGPADAVADARAQLDRLVHPGFVTETGADRVVDLARYLQAISIRLESLPRADPRDAVRMAGAQLLEHEYADVLQSLPADRRDDADVVAVRWLLEELRVSYFAQRLGTRVPVSDRRVQRAIQAL